MSTHQPLLQTVGHCSHHLSCGCLNLLSPTMRHIRARPRGASTTHMATSRAGDATQTCMLVDRFWARLTEICTFLSSTCHGGRGLPNSVFLGLFLKNNGPVWHFQPPVCSFWLEMGHFWHFCRPGLQQPHICNTQTAHPGQRKPPNLQTTNPFGHQCMARYHGALQRPMQGTWFGPQISILAC